MADAAYHIRDGPSWPVGGQGPARGQRLDVVALTAIPCAAFIPTFVAGQKAIRRGAVAVAGLLIGIFAVTAVMTGIIAGGIGLRLVHADSKHKNAADAVIAEWPAAKDSLRNGEPYGRALPGAHPKSVVDPRTICTVIRCARKDGGRQARPRLPHMHDHCTCGLGWRPPRALVPARRRLPRHPLRASRLFAAMRSMLSGRARTCSLRRRALQTRDTHHTRLLAGVLGVPFADSSPPCVWRSFRRRTCAASHSILRVREW